MAIRESVARGARSCAGFVVAVGLLQCFVSWKHRAVLAGVCSSAAVLLGVAAISAHPSTRVAWTLLVLDLVALMIALALFTLGQVVWRLLADVEDKLVRVTERPPRS